MNCLLLGNGLNRLAMQSSWQQLLEQLSAELGLQATVKPHASKPLSLLFEELCVRLPGRSARSAELEVKKRIADLTQAFPPHPLLERLATHFQTILTTNYDVSAEDAIAATLYHPQPLSPESRYSLFRCNHVGTHRVWHIHGEATQPQSILLGYDHYAGYLQKIRNYVTDGVPLSGKQGQIKSPLRAGNHDFERFTPHSWVDHFLRDHVHIVGLGLDFTEIDLWWLLVHKRRRDKQTGRTFFYAIDLGKDEGQREEAKLSTLRSLGVEVVVVRAPSYQAGYELLVPEVKRNAGRLTTWLPQKDMRRHERVVCDMDLKGDHYSEGNVQRQMNLRLRRK